MFGSESTNYVVYELKHHFGAYLILLLGLIAGTFSFIYFWPNHEVQRVVAIALAIFYFAWGVVTHVKAQKITPRVISEYFAVSLLAGGLLYFLTL